ncbi:orotidine-5'-phosphate decarboxylase [Lentibacillus sediminis]|uniref:orotidine-5'-phosphate decarboxylase n=1 Tax=Lentibacillus sediminis TaxID=1940529 RepID=UPI000C1C5CD3|nr:orotidine-5'-phosphate decarboxylase [Lentibacillus sediminis]
MCKTIYLALDFPDWKHASYFLESNQLKGVPVKVGMELFYREGPHVIEKLKENGHPVFLDLKLHDIPNTVQHAMHNLASLEVDIVNVHALGGGEMIKRAKEGLVSGKRHSHETKLIAVTLLTSHDEMTIKNELKMSGKMENNSKHLALIAKENEADGAVCSAYEASLIKEVCGADFLAVTPGIRLKGSTPDDQKRIADPGFARKNGADILVVGRSITQAALPYTAYQQAVKEWKHGLPL